MKIYRLVQCIILSMILICSCRLSKDENVIADTESLLPSNGDVSGFNKKGETALMNDYKTLMATVDGAAQKYVDLGFVDGVQQIYSNGEVDIDLHVFNFGTRDDAKKCFDAYYPTSVTVLSKGIPEAVVDETVKTGYTIYYMRDNIYIEVVIGTKSKFARNMGIQFYLNLDNKISSQNK